MLICNLTPLDGRFVNAIVFYRKSEFLWIHYLFTHSTFNLCKTIRIYSFYYKTKLHLYFVTFLLPFSIFQYVTQCSTLTRKIHSSSSSVYLIPIYTLLAEVHAWIKVTIKGKLSSMLSRLKDLSTKLKGVGSSTIFLFVFFRFSRPWQVDWVQIKSYMTFIRGNRCIERTIIWKKYGGDTSSCTG